ncbi:MAG: hypothetical protein IPP63_12900 [Chloracidobacterium sp.]|nr:hypothetical protein [Chloracidobacterium sp.]
MSRRLLLWMKRMERSGYKRFLHSDKAGIKAFYRKCGKDAVIGTEATGSLWWFEKLLFDNGMTLKIGDRG